MTITIEILGLILFLIFLFSISYLLFRSIVTPLGLYALIWGAVLVTAITSQEEYSFSKDMYYQFILSWASFSFGCIFLYFMVSFKGVDRNKTDLLKIIDLTKLKKIMVFLTLSGFIFSIIYFYEMLALLSGLGLEKEMIRHFVYAKSGEISTQVFTRRWYVISLGIALIVLGAIMSAIYMSLVKKDEKIFYKLVAVMPIFSAIFFCISEMSRGRIIDIMIIYFLTILSIKYWSNLTRFLRYEYKLLLFLFFAGIITSSAITKARGIAFDENILLNFFANVINYFLVSIVAFDASLNYLEKMGLRAIFYPVFYLFERIGLIPVGKYPDPTQLTASITYPTPTYLFWLNSGYGLFSILIIPFFVGLFSTYFYVNFRRTRDIKYLMFLICSYILIGISPMSWRLYDLWYWIILISLIPISNLLVSKKKICTKE